ncbi:MAG: FeoA family protein [Saprospiraceae bacterium]
MFKPIIAKSLLDIKEGKICGFNDENFSRLLISKGILIGSLAKLIRVSPFGNTYYVQIDGLRFGLRKQEIDVIQVTEA